MIKVINESEARSSVSTDVLLRIIIPTLNRPRELICNVSSLVNNLSRVSEKIDFEIIVSENCSDAGKEIDTSSIMNTINNQSPIVFVRRSTRLDLGEHVRWLSHLPPVPWVMWLGDDDLLTPTYVNYVLTLIRKDTEESVTAIVPGYGNISARSFFELAETEEVIDYHPDVTEYTMNLESSVHVVNRGHQLSGLVIRSFSMTHALADALPLGNLYPWMCYLALCLKEGAVLEVDGLHARITSDSPKLFSYRRDGLLPDIVESIMCGFSDDTPFGTKVATEVLKTRAYWRIFKTSRTGIGCLINYLRLWKDRRISKEVFLKCLPRVFFGCVRYQLGQLKRLIVDPA